MTTPSGRLAEKVVLISGTGGGQGRVAAEIFAREGARADRVTTGFVCAASFATDSSRLSICA